MDDPYLDAFERDADAPERVQRELLARTLSGFAGTAYGRRFCDADPSTAEGFAAAVPLVRHEDLLPWIDRIEAGEPDVLNAERTVAFFRTSGSTSTPKLIPVTASLMRQKVAAFAVFWGGVYRDHPGVRTGTLVSNFIDAGGSERTGSGLEICSESSFWARRGRGLHGLRRWPLPAELRRVADVDARLYAIARLLLQSPLHCIMCLNPSTLLQFCRTVAERSGELADGLRTGSWGTRDASVLAALDIDGAAALRSHLVADPAAARRLAAATRDGRPPPLRALWPELELVVCWRSGIVQPYFSQLAPYTDGVPVRDYVSQSSECMMAIPLADGTSGGTLAYTSHFFEFIAETDVDDDDPATRFAWQLDAGMRYELVVTTGGGLYRYRTGDCVRVDGFSGRVPVIEFLYRLGRTSSVTGEKLTEHQVLEAAREAAVETGHEPFEFLCHPCTGRVPHYGVMVDSPAAPVDAKADAAADAPPGDDPDARWLAAFERGLERANSEYRDKRASGRLGPVRLRRVARHALARARAARKAPGVSDEQVKAEVLTARLDCHRDVDPAVPAPRPPDGHGAGT